MYIIHILSRRWPDNGVICRQFLGCICIRNGDQYQFWASLRISAARIEKKEKKREKKRKKENRPPTITLRREV